MTDRETPATGVATRQAVTDLILRIFRVNGSLLHAGDRLVAPLGLTSARWQLLGGIAAADEPQPIAQLARAIGISRQAVQRIANELEQEGVIRFRPNPRHKRAQLVLFTPHGQALFDAAIALQEPWAERLAGNLTAEQVETACDALDGLAAILEVMRNEADG